MTVPSGAPGLHALLNYFGINLRFDYSYTCTFHCLGINYKSVIGALWDCTCTPEITLTLLNGFQITVGTKIISDPEKCFRELISGKLLILLRHRPCLEIIIFSSNFQVSFLAGQITGISLTGINSSNKVSKITGRILPRINSIIISAQTVISPKLHLHLHFY